MGRHDQHSAKHMHAVCGSRGGKGACPTTHSAALTSSASLTCRDAASGSEYTATDLIPRARAERDTRQEISPRLAIKILSNSFSSACCDTARVTMDTPRTAPKPRRAAPERTKRRGPTAPIRSMVINADHKRVQHKANATRFGEDGRRGKGRGGAKQQAATVRQLLQQRHTTVLAEC